MASPMRLSRDNGRQGLNVREGSKLPFSAKPRSRLVSGVELKKSWSKPTF